MSTSNCVAFAVRLYVRRARKGRRGYLVLRRSHWGRFPHMLFGRARADGSLALVSYVPTDPHERKMPPPCFGGRVRWGDL